MIRIRSGRIGVVLMTLSLAAAMALGCQALTGEDGTNGKNGTKGPVGPQGPQGTSLVDSLPCATGCIDGRTSIKDAVVDQRVLAAGSVTQIKIGGTVEGNKIANQAVNTDNIADLAVGSTELADNSITGPLLAQPAVTAANGALAADAVQAGNLAADAVVNGDIAPGAVLPGDIAAGAVGPGDLGAGAVIPQNGSTLGSIAADAVSTRHLADGAVYQIWTMKGTTNVSTSSSTWQTLGQMNWDMSQGSGGQKVYWVMFNGSFYSQDASDSYNNRFEVMIAEVDASNVVVDIKDRQTLVSDYEQPASFNTCTVGWRYCCNNCYGCGVYVYSHIGCNFSHIHVTTSPNNLGSVTLSWVGELDSGSGHTLEVMYRSLSGQTIHQNPVSTSPVYGDRVFTIIELKNAAITYVP